MDTREILRILTGTAGAALSGLDQNRESQNAVTRQKMAILMDELARQQQQGNADRTYALDLDQFKLQRGIQNLKPYEEGARALRESDQSAREHAYRMAEIAAQGAQYRQTQGQAYDLGKGYTPSQRMDDILKMIAASGENALRQTATPDSNASGGYAYNVKDPNVMFWNPASQQAIESAGVLIDKNAYKKLPPPTQSPYQQIADILKARGRAFMPKENAGGESEQEIIAGLDTYFKTNPVQGYNWRGLQSKYPSLDVKKIMARYVK